MKNNQLKKGISFILAIAMIFTIFVTVTVPTSAEDYVYNWGTRGVVCTDLSSYAKAFYTGIYVFDDMSKTQGGSSQSNGHQSDLYAELKALMTSKHRYQTSYNATKELYRYTDCQGGGGKISSFYSGASIGPGWGEGGSWNREHTWPDSKGLGGADENDIMMLRPTATSENSSRGNTAYGKSSGYYDPNRESNGALNLHGDVARICLYVYTRWGNTSKMWGTGGVMENLEVLLEWMEEDPVDTWEMGRNDAVESITGTRNVFVDYPEYAWLLFGRNVPSDYASPSGNKGATGGTNPGEVTGSGNTGLGNTGSGTTATQMTIPQALAAADGTLITVTGTVKSIDQAWNTQYNDMSVIIADDAGNEIYIYRIKIQVAVGDNITVTGTRYTYNDLKELKDVTATINTNTGGGNTGGGNTGGGNTGGGNTGGNQAGQTVNYTFSDYPEGTQYAANEVHKLDDVLTVTTNDAHFSTQIRLYFNDGSNGYDERHGTAIFASTQAINGLSLNAGHKQAVLKVFGSNDGQTWTLIDEISVSETYADYDVDMQNGEYTYIKLEATVKQIRVASISVVYAAAEEIPDGGDQEGTTPDGEQNTDETDGEQNTGEADGEQNTGEADGEQNTGEADGEQNTDEADGEQNTDEADGEQNTDEADGEQNTDEANGELNTDDEQGNGGSDDKDQENNTNSDDETEENVTSDNGNNDEEQDVIIDLAPKGCGSSIGGGLAVIISFSIAGVMLLRKKEEE